MGRMEERLYGTIKEYLDSIDWSYEEDKEGLMIAYPITLKEHDIACVSYIMEETQTYGIYSTLEYNLDPSKRDEICWLVNEYNTALTTGRYFYDEGSNVICCTIESAYDESLISKSAVADMLAFLVSNAGAIEKSIVGFTTGELTKEQALDVYLEEDVSYSSKDFVDNTEKVYNTICDALDSIDYVYEREPDHLSVAFSVTGDDERVGYSIRASREYKTIKLTSFLCDVQPGTEDKMLYAINYANNNITMGSLYISDGSIFYFSNLLFAESLISKESILDLFRCSFDICDGLNDKLIELGEGLISIDDFKQIFN